MRDLPSAAELSLTTIERPSGEMPWSLLRRQSDAVSTRMASFPRPRAGTRAPCCRREKCVRRATSSAPRYDRGCDRQHGVPRLRCPGSRVRMRSSRHGRPSALWVMASWRRARLRRRRTNPCAAYRRCALSRRRRVAKASWCRGSRRRSGSDAGRSERHRASRNAFVCRYPFERLGRAHARASATCRLPTGRREAATKAEPLCRVDGEIERAVEHGIDMGGGEFQLMNGDRRLQVTRQGGNCIWCEVRDADGTETSPESTSASSVPASSVGWVKDRGDGCKTGRSARP